MTENKSSDPSPSSIQRLSYPLILLAIHLLVFLFTFPKMDLPVADDANYFGSGKIFVTLGDGLRADWTPILTYTNALCYALIPLSWIGRFALYSFMCRLVLLWGIYAFVSRYTKDRRWAFVSTILAAVCFSYWIQMNGRAFANGALLLLLAWMADRKDIDAISALSLTAIGYLFRPEHILVCGGFTIYAAWRLYREKSWIGLIRPTRRTAARFALCLLLWIPILIWGKTSTDRLTFAFSQAFVTFAEETRLLNDSVPNEVDSWNHVVDDFFPVPQRNEESFLSRSIPLYGIAISNPVLFARFVGWNVTPFLTLTFSTTKTTGLAVLINLYIAVSFVILFLASPEKLDGCNRRRLLFLSFVLTVSVMPCLLTRPFRDYIFTAVLWFFCVIPYFSWRSEKQRRWIPIVLMAAVLPFQIVNWNAFLSDHAEKRNWKRAEILDEAFNNRNPEGAVVAESYPIFSTAFNDSVKRSVHYNVKWDSAGRLRAYHERGDLIDFVLLEDNPPQHLTSISEELRRTMKRWGKEILNKNGYALYHVNRRQVAPPGQVIITEDDGNERDASGSAVKADENNRRLVIHWNFNPESFNDFHVYVSVNGEKYQYIGHTNNGEAICFSWDASNPQLEPDFRMGPQFGCKYQFRVYGIPSKDSPHKPPWIQNKRPVLFTESLQTP